MPTFIAPGVYVIERDFSQYVAGLQQTSIGMVSTSKRGPLNVPTLCTTPEQFLAKFGEPVVGGYGAHAALNYLRQGNRLTFNRVAKEYEPGAALITSMGSPAGDGYTYTFNVSAGHSLQVGDYVRLSQTGKPTTQNAKITTIVGTAITVDVPLLAAYSASGSSDSDVAVSASSGAAASAEVFGLSRYGGQVSRLVKFTAKDPGNFANFGSRQGIEVVIEDGGQFTNINESTGLPYETEGGIPLQGVVPSAPSVDSKKDLIQLTYANGRVRVGEMRGVNRDAAAAVIMAIASGGSSSSSGSATAILTVNSTTGFEDGGTVTISDNSDGYDGELTVVAVLSSTEIEVTGFTVPIVDGATDGFIEYVTNGYGIVYRCTDADADGSLGYSTWSAIGVLTKRVRVLYQGRQVEVFDNLIGYDTSSSNFWDTAIGSPTNQIANSEYIYAEYLGSGEQPINSFNRVKHPYNPRLLMGAQTSVKTAATEVAGSVLLDNAKGYNGENPSSSDYIGETKDDGTTTGLQSFRKSELYDVNMLAVPGVSLAAVIQAMISVLDARNDCLGIIDPPFGLSAQEVTDWHNGTGVYSGLHTAFTTNRAALYWPWVKQHDPYTSRDVWLPPSAFVPGVIAYSDRVGESWFAPAGIQRGKVQNALSVESVVTLGEIESFYGPLDGNAINAIATFAKDGVVVYGQRTLQRYPSALDRINVRRLLFYIEKSLASMSRLLNFEQNDEILWSQFENLVRPFMDNLYGRRAIEEYGFKCDAETNTAFHRNNNEVSCKLYVVPIKSAEKVILNVTVLPSGINVEEFINQDV